MLAHESTQAFPHREFGARENEALNNNWAVLPRQPSALIVDADAGLRDDVRTTLVASGFLVGEANTGKGAIYSAAQCSFDVVLLDMNLCGVSGIDVCRRIRALAPRTRIVVVTGPGEEDGKTRALEAGADYCVTKPFKFREVVASLRAVLQLGTGSDNSTKSDLTAGRAEGDPNGFPMQRPFLRYRLPPYDQAKLKSLRLNQFRKAIRANAVSFPSQVPTFERHDRQDIQAKVVQLYFVLGWSCTRIASRHGITPGRVTHILKVWKQRAVETGYVQYIPPAESLMATAMAYRTVPHMQARRIAGNVPVGP